MIRIISEEELSQGSDAWLEIRHKFVTGTDAVKLMRGEKIENILRDKAQSKSFNTFYTVRGHALEEDAKELYGKLNGVQIQNVGFVINDEYNYCGVSPDGLLGDDCVVEVKCFKPEVQLREFKNLTPAIIAQTQYEMFVTQRPYCQFIMYCPDITDLSKVLLTKRIEANMDAWKIFAERLGKANNEN